MITGHAGLPPEELLAKGGVYATLAVRQLQRGREQVAEGEDGVNAALETLLTGTTAPPPENGQAVANGEPNGEPNTGFDKRRVRREDNGVGDSPPSLTAGATIC